VAELIVAVVAELIAAAAAELIAAVLEWIAAVVDWIAAVVEWIVAEVGRIAAEDFGEAVVEETGCVPDGALLNEAAFGVVERSCWTKSVKDVDQVQVDCFGESCQLESVRTAPVYGWTEYQAVVSRTPRFHRESRILHCVGQPPTAEYRN